VKSLRAGLWTRFALIALIGASASALYADNIQATYEPAGTQTANTAALCAAGTDCWIGTEDFNSWDGSQPFTTNFPTQYSTGGLSGGAITGTYSGGLIRYPADTYGGAGATGYYPELFASGGSYTLTLTASGGLPGVNYFGLWFSALDAGNDLKFYNNGTLLYDFTPALFQSLVGACPNSSNAFCGNPNNTTEDSGEQFAYLNFFDLTGYFNQIVFTETGGGGFESDNHTVGYQDPPTPEGTDIGTVPEPGSFVLLSIGSLALLGLMRRPALKAVK
jgi:hypothetical protein